MKELGYMGRETGCESALPNPNWAEAMWSGADGSDGRFQILQLLDWGKGNSVLGDLVLWWGLGSCFWKLNLESTFF